MLQGGDNQWRAFGGNASGPILVAALKQRAAAATSLPVMRGSGLSHCACHQCAVGEPPNRVQMSFHCCKSSATIRQGDADRVSPSPTVVKSSMGSSSRFVSRWAGPAPVCACFSAHIAQDFAFAAACRSFCFRASSYALSAMRRRWTGSSHGAPVNAALSGAPHKGSLRRVIDG